MNQQILVLLIPAFIGLIITLLNKDSINQFTENVEQWFRNAHASITSNNGWFKRIVLKPLYWLVIKFSDWTDGFTHRGLKNGVRFALTLYLILIWTLLVIYAFAFVLGLLFIYALFIIFLKSNTSSESSYQSNKKVIGIAGSGKKIDQETGVIQEKGVFGYTDTNKRINPETGNLQTKGIFGWVDTETKIDQETGNIQKKGIFGYDSTDTRINPDTGIIQKKSIFGWEDTNERINPETGKHQEKGIFGWTDK